MSDICEWFTQSIDLAEDVVKIKFSDGTTKTVKRGLYLKEVEDNVRKMLIDQVAEEKTIPLSVIEDIKAEIEDYHLSSNEVEDEDSVKWGMKIAIEIIDKHISGKETADDND